MGSKLINTYTVNQVMKVLRKNKIEDELRMTELLFFVGLDL